MAIDHSASAFPKTQRKRKKNHSRRRKTLSIRKMVIRWTKLRGWLCSIGTVGGAFGADLQTTSSGHTFILAGDVKVLRGDEHVTLKLEVRVL